MIKSFTVRIAIFLLFTPLLTAFEESLIIGMEDNWTSLVVMDGLVLHSGWEGYYDLFLADGEYFLNSQESARDLLLHFNGPGQDIPSSAYIGESQTNQNYSSREKILGGGALALQSENVPLVFLPVGDAVFAPGNMPEDFSIEFWLYPARLSEGERIFSWEGGWRGKELLLSQEINCTVSDQKLIWSFMNFFLPPEGAETEFVLAGDTSILPRRWHHHLIRYDSISGLLEYLIDGIPEAVIYTTPSRREEGEIFLPVCGSLANTKISLGDGFIGLMDEFRLSSKFVQEPQLERFRRQEGSAVTRLFDLSQSETPVKRIEIKETTPANSDIYYFYRLSDNLFLREDNAIPWTELIPGESLAAGTAGRYLQLRMDLLPDGTGELSPSVSSIKIVYESRLPPLPPAYVTAVPGDGSIRLKWNAMTSSEIQGFRIYYGDKPGVYFGTSVLPGNDSPIDLGVQSEYLLEGLENGKLYYLAVIAYSGSYGDLISEFSQEVSARPSSLYRIRQDGY